MNAPSGSDSPATLKDTYRFFIPLMFMAELMMISHAVIAAFLARMDDPAPILAAYSIAFYLHATLGSPVWTCQIVAVSFIRDRVSIRRLAIFGLQTTASVGWIWLLIALTPIGDWMFQTFFGVSEAVATTARSCLLVSLLIPPITVARSIAYGLMMVKRRTTLVTAGTIIRLCGLGILLALLTRQFEGALVGIWALVGCISIETVYSVAVASRFYRDLPDEAQPPPGYRELWRFSWPLMLMQFAESGVAFAVNFFLGRLPRPELAIAAFAVLDSLMRVTLSALRNLVFTTQTLLKSDRDLRTILVFATHMAIGFSVLMLIIDLAPVRALVLGSIMGLPATMAEYVAPAVAVSFLLALFMATAGVTRGLIIVSRRTGVIAFSAGARVAAVVLVGFTALAFGGGNGAMIGMLALIAAAAAETAVLAGRLVVLHRRPGGLLGDRPA